MRQELKDKLQSTFPTFFRQHHALPTCGEGWFPLLWDLCNEIQALNPPSDFEVSQVKEKFGGLRFYVNGATKEIYDAIHKAESASYKTCEECGKPGESNNDGWIHTLCDTCEAQRK